MSDYQTHLRSLLQRKEINHAIDRLTTLIYSKNSNTNSRGNSPVRRSHSKSPRTPRLMLTPQMSKGEEQALFDITNMIEDVTYSSDNFYLEEKQPKSPMETVKRLYDLEKRREIKLKELKIKRFQEENKKLSFTPEINETSRILAEKVGQRNKPFHLRSGDYLSKRNADLEQIRRTIEIEKQAKERENKESDWSSRLSTTNSTTQRPKIDNKLMTPKQRKPNEFVEDMSNWAKKKRDNLIGMHVEKLERENDGLTFQPEINRKSLILAKKNKPEGRVEERLLRFHQQKLAKEKQEELNIKYAQNLSPMISKKSQILAERYRSKLKGTDSAVTMNTNPSSTHSITPNRKRVAESGFWPQEF